MSDPKLGDETLDGHGGSMDGFRSLLVYLPEEKLAVAYTSNGMFTRHKRPSAAL